MWTNRAEDVQQIHLETTEFASRVCEQILRRHAAGTARARSTAPSRCAHATRDRTRRLCGSGAIRLVGRATPQGGGCGNGVGNCARSNRTMAVCGWVGEEEGRGGGRGLGLAVGRGPFAEDEGAAERRRAEPRACAGGSARRPRRGARRRLEHEGRGGPERRSC